MAIALYDLLSLPTTSSGFSEFSNTNNDNFDETPARKIPRLDGDSDVSSGMRPPITIQITGKRPSAPAPKDAKAEFDIVTGAIRMALQRPPPLITSPYSELFRACFSIVCVKADGNTLYRAYQTALESAIRTVSSQLHSSDKEGVDWIGLFADVCSWFSAQIQLLRSLLAYLDQVYVSQQENLLSIEDLAYATFLRHIWEDVNLATRLRTALEDWATYERNNWMHHEERKHIVGLFTQIQAHEQYAPFFEFYLTITRKYYRTESEEKSKALSAPAFFNLVDNRIQDELERVSDILPPESWPLVRECVEKSLVDGRIEWLANKTMRFYIEANDVVHLQKLYSLFERVGQRMALCTSFKVYATEEVSKVLKDVSKDDDMVPSLLKIRADLNRIIGTCFDSYQPFIYRLTDAFSTAFKLRRNKPAEMLAKHLDKILRKGQGATSDAEFNQVLEDVLGLYRFTDDKDVFRRFYHRQLAKRLILDKTASTDFEKQMLERLKSEYDPEFGLALEMFKDLSLSKELTEGYHRRLKSAEALGHTLNAIVLQRSSWPFTSPAQKFDLPPSMQEQLQSFELYYKDYHQGRTLDWDHSLGSCSLIARFRKGKKELGVSLYQTVVLLLFNDEDELTFTDIQDQTRIEDDELRRTLQSLSLGKKRVLKKHPMQKDVHDSDKFSFNNDFEDPRAKVHINSIQAKVSVDESVKTQQSIDSDRVHTIDAAIVRIMKGAKVLALQQITMKVSEEVIKHFKPEVVDIKKRVEQLVEMEYLERDEETKDVFRYLA